MKYARRAATLLVVALLSSAALAANPRRSGAPRPIVIDYGVVRDHADDRERFVVTLRFTGDSSGFTPLILPGDWASAHHAERGIEGLAVTNAGSRLEDTGEAHVKRIVHRPGERLTVRYALVRIPPDATQPTPYLPLIEPTCIAWIGWTTWVVPAGDEEPVRVRVRFHGLPDEWNFASSFGLDRRNVAYSGTMRGFRNAIFVAGDVRLRSRAVRGGQLITAVRGAWPFRDSQLADRVASIVDGERTFWNDASQPAFLVTLMPSDGGKSRSSIFEGTGLERSFATFITGVPKLDNLDFLFTHEYFHTWNPRALGRFNGPPASMYWFSEGFTEYYSHLLRLRWGMLTLDQFAAEFDSVLKALSVLREKHLPNSEIGPRFFTEAWTVGKLPYWRGMLLAAKWDAEIHAASHGMRSLDDAMRAMRDENRGGDAVIDAARIARVMREHGVVDSSGDIERFVDAGQTIVLPRDTLTSCVGIEPVSEVPFEPGFDIVATMRTDRLMAVDPLGAAHAAGLREGDLVRSADMHHEADRIATIGIQVGDEDRERKVSFLPAGKPVERQRVVVRSETGAMERSKCLASLGVPLH